MPVDAGMAETEPGAAIMSRSYLTLRAAHARGDPATRISHHPRGEELPINHLTP
jgi:hypothetical protein